MLCFISNEYFQTKVIDLNHTAHILDTWYIVNLQYCKEVSMHYKHYKWHLYRNSQGIKFRNNCLLTGNFYMKTQFSIYSNMLGNLDFVKYFCHIYYICLIKFHYHQFFMCMISSTLYWFDHSWYLQGRFVKNITGFLWRLGTVLNFILCIQYIRCLSNMQINDVVLSFLYLFYLSTVCL